MVSGNRSSGRRVGDGRQSGPARSGGRARNSSKNTARQRDSKSVGGTERGASRFGSKDRAQGGGAARRQDQSGSKRHGSQASGGDRGWSNKASSRGDLTGAAVDLPPWIVDDLTRVTPKERVAAALAELGAAAAAMEEGRYKVALRAAKKAKELASRDVTVRETIGLAAYRVGEWTTALSELRTYRRLSGESTHVPIEMDVLRALGRHDDMADLWRDLQKQQAAPAVVKEGLVVYASHLIDAGRPDLARSLTTPKRLIPNPYPADLRVWYVAARANALTGDGRAAGQIRDAVLVADPGFPGIDDLESVIARAKG